MPWVTLVALSIGASGCYQDEPRPMTMHKPGVYKGAVDPIVEKQRSPEQQETLLARFKQVQTDR
jgi:hypothetical protein